MADKQDVALDSTAPIDRVVRWCVVAALAVLTWQYARMGIGANVEGGFLHLPDLVFHEAGHMILMPFGRFVSVLGGSLFQVLIPVVCVGAFLRQENPFAAAVGTWWAGQNLIDLAPYIADARRLQLVLLGGQTGAEVEGHDWEYLLTATGLLRYDIALGRTAQVLGIVVMLAALGLAIRSIVSSREPADSA